MKKSNRNSSSNKKYFYISLLSVFTVIFAWWLITDFFKLTSPDIFPGPLRIAKTFVVKMYDPNPDGGTLIEHMFASLKLALLGYVMGIVIGIPLGILMAWYKTVDRFVKPIFDMLRPIPGIAWIPILIITFGIGIFPKAIVIFLTAFIAVTVNSYSGIKQTRDVHIWVARTFGATKHEMLLLIAIPSALPYIMTGLRVALGASWSALVAAELLASNKGLGFMIQQCRGLYRPDVIIVGMISVGIIGGFLTKFVSLLENKMLKGR